MTEAGTGPDDGSATEWMSCTPCGYPRPTPVRQRVDELSLGVRPRTYELEPDELTGSIDRLLDDRPLRKRLAGISAASRASPGTVRAADQSNASPPPGGPVTASP